MTCRQCGGPSVAPVCSRECLDASRRGEHPRTATAPLPTNPLPQPEEHRLGDLEFCPCACGRTRGEVRRLGHAP